MNFPDGRLRLVCLNEVLDGSAADAAPAAEAWRLLEAGGTLLVAGSTPAVAVLPRLEAAGFEIVARCRYASAVLRFDWHPVLVLRKPAA